MKKGKPQTSKPSKQCVHVKKANSASLNERWRSTNENKPFDLVTNNRSFYFILKLLNILDS